MSWLKRENSARDSNYHGTQRRAVQGCRFRPGRVMAQHDLQLAVLIFGRLSKNVSTQTQFSSSQRAAITSWQFQKTVGLQLQVLTCGKIRSEGYARGKAEHNRPPPCCSRRQCPNFKATKTGTGRSISPRHGKSLRQPGGL